MNDINELAISTTQNRLKNLIDSLEYEESFMNELNDFKLVQSITQFERLRSHYVGYYGTYSDWQIDMFDDYYYHLDECLEKYTYKGKTRLNEIQKSINIENHILSVLGDTTK